MMTTIQDKEPFRKWPTDSSEWELLKLIDRVLQENDGIIERHLKRFQEDPFNAFGSADQTMAAAAIQMVFRRAKSSLLAIDSKSSFASVREFAYDRLRDAAISPGQSSSACTNIMARCELAAWAKLLSKMDYL
jgi:hypothetical protein